MANSTPKPRALDGLVVVELGEGVEPAYCGKWLSAFGAEVLKVEPRAGDWTRRYRLSESGQAERGDSPLYLHLNTGKKSVALDLDVAENQVVLQKLIAGADVVIHNLEPAALRELGIDRYALRALNPALVAVAMSPFGADGPYSAYAASSSVLLALGGYQYLSGEPGREPLAFPGFQPECCTALYGVVAALAGVLGREQRGRGCGIEVSSLEVMASLHQYTTSQYLHWGGAIRSRHGSRMVGAAGVTYPITMLPCRDGYIGFCLTQEVMWERLCLLLERPDLVKDPRFVPPVSLANAEALDEVLVEGLGRWDRMQFFHRAQELRIPVTPMYDLGEVLKDPQYSARGFWIWPEGETDGPLYPGMPVRMSETPWSVGRSPWLGEHNDEIASLSIHPDADSSPAGSPAGPPPDRLGRAAGVVPRYLLDGLRVLDFTTVWSGPLCAHILADLGAEVIRIERPPAPTAPQVPAGTPTGNWVKLNRNKLQVCIDMTLPKGRDLIRGLAAKSDVLVENFSPRVMPNLGLAYAELRKVNPSLIMLSMPGFGSEGPYRDYVAYGPSIEPMTGLASLLGYPGEAPMATGIAYPDAVAGMSGVGAIFVALVYRQRTGLGQFIDLSQVEGMTNLLGEYALDYQITGRLPERIGNWHPHWAPHGTYRCRGEDEWVSIAVRTQEEWTNFCKATGLEPLLAQPDYATESKRREHRRRLDEEISTWTGGKSKYEVMEVLQSVGVPAGAVLNARELLENAHLAHRGFYVDAKTRRGDTFRIPGTPLVVDGRRREEWHASPELGEYNREVCQRVLGLSIGEIEALEAEGVLRSVPPTQ